MWQIVSPAKSELKLDNIDNAGSLRGKSKDENQTKQDGTKPDSGFFPKYFGLNKNIVTCIAIQKIIDNLT